MKTPPSNTLGFLKTTAIGGVLFLLPIVVVIVLLGYVLKGVVSVHGVLKEWIPFDSATGIALLFVLAVILIFAACFAAGLIAHRAIGAHFSRTMESHLMKVYPKYGIYKDLLAGKFGGDRERSFALPSPGQERRMPLSRVSSRSAGERPHRRLFSGLAGCVEWFAGVGWPGQGAAYGCTVCGTD